MYNMLYLRVRGIDSASFFMIFLLNFLIFSTVRQCSIFCIHTVHVYTTHWGDIYTGGLLVPEGIIILTVSISSRGYHPDRKY